MKKKIKGKIRLIKKTDLLRCQDIIYNCLDVACDNDSQIIRFRKIYSFDFLEKCFRDSNIFYIFEADKKVLGMGRIGGKNGVKTVYVDPGYHGQGIGKRIIARLEDFAQKNKTKKLYLNAIRSAIPFYEKLGYNKVKDYKKRDNRMEKVL